MVESQIADLRESLAREVRVITARHDDLRVEHNALKRAHDTTVRELEAFRRTTRDQDVLIRQLAGWFSSQCEFCVLVLCFFHGTTWLPRWLHSRFIFLFFFLSAYSREVTEKS